MRSLALSRIYPPVQSTMCSYCWTTPVMRQSPNKLPGYGYGYGGFTGTGTSPPSSASAPYGNSSTSYYIPTGTAPFSTGTPSTSADPNTTTISGSPAPYANATFYSGAPYKTYNFSASGYYPTYHHHPTHGPYPFPSGKPIYTKRSSNTTGDPSAKFTWASGTAASTGLASAPSSFGTSGGYTYTAPKGIPSEYFYHHRKPKRNVSRFTCHPSICRKEVQDILTDGNCHKAPNAGGYGYWA